MFCDRCGLNFLPKQSVCTRCKSVPTRYWFQLMGLVTLMVALASNSLIGMYLLPRMAEGNHSRFFFRAWLWFDLKAALYGWVPLTIAFLVWDYMVWKEARPKIRGWFTRKLLTFALVTSIAPVLPWWVPAGQPPGEFLSMIGRHPGVPALLAWGVVIVVAVLVCFESESRDYLLGHGKMLNLISLGMLLLVLTLTVVGWSITYG